jgi:hypothetical protein
MRLIDVLTADPNQSLTIVLDDGTKVDMTLTFKENQQGWFYSLTYGVNFSVNNRRLVNGPNIIRQFRNIVPFGLACLATDGHEPIYIDDFTSGRVSVYILNQIGKDAAEEVIAGNADA